MQKNRSKRQKTGSEGSVSALYVIIEVSPLPPCPCPLHSIPLGLQTLAPPSFIKSPPPPHWYCSHDDDGCCCPSSSISADKKVSDGMSILEEGFVSGNSSNSDAGYVIHSIGI